MYCSCDGHEQIIASTEVFFDADPPGWFPYCTDCADTMSTMPQRALTSSLLDYTLDTLEALLIKAEEQWGAPAVNDVPADILELLDQRRDERGDAPEPIPDGPTRIGHRVRLERTNRGLSQRQLASLVGVSVPHISKIEAGRETPSTNLIGRFAVVLHLDELELLLVARRLPDDLQETLAVDPAASAAMLRSWQHETQFDDGGAPVGWDS